MRVAGEVLAQRVRVSRLLAVVELLPDRARELVDQLANVQEVECAHPLLRDARRLVEQRQVGLDLAGRAGALHLDGDDLAVRQHGTMNLADRGGGDGLAVELDEQSLEGVTKVFLDDALDVLVRERPHVVLEAAQLGDDVGRQHVRPHRQELPELDERRAELVEHFPQVLAALGRRALDERGAATAGQEVGQPVPFEEVAEAVPDGDLGDLRQASEVACAVGRLGHDLQCSTRKGRPLVRRVRDCPRAALDQAYPMLELRDAELELLVVPARD